MTRKDFVLIAETVNALPVPVETRREVAESFAAALKITNDRFDAGRFVAACQASA